MVSTRFNIRKKLLVHGCTCLEFELVEHPGEAIRLRLLLSRISSDRHAFFWDADSTASLDICTGAGVRELLDKLCGMIMSEDDLAIQGLSNVCFLKRILRILSRFLIW